MLERVYYGNTAQEYLVALGTFLLSLAVFLGARRLIVGRLRWLADRTATHLDDLFVDLLEMIRQPECYLVAFYFAARTLALRPGLELAFRDAVILTVTYRVATMVRRIARFAIEEGLLHGRERDATYVHTSATLGYVANFIIWAGAALFALDNLGFSVRSMLAGLGIGGIAVALAAQAVLGDLFAAIAIFLDRPFVLGDAITFGDVTGTVEQIGFKTTRLRALSGELLVVPNSALASAKIQNWRHLGKRRVVLAYGVAYGTPREKLAALPGQLARLIAEAGQGKTTVDRVHLKELGDSSIDFEAVYFVMSGDYALHMDIQQRLHLSVLELFEREGIEIPFPTHTIELSKPA